MLTTGLQVPVYNQEKTTDTFIYTTGMSALDGFFCLFLDERGRRLADDALISIAAQGKTTE